MQEFKINNILIGHHQDDLIENFFIRMARGSGLKGLISLSEKSKFQDKNIFRPLLDHKKEDLIFLSKYIFNFLLQIHLILMKNLKELGLEICSTN